MLQHQQHQIKQQLRDEKVLSLLRDWVVGFSGPKKFAIRICQEFGFFAPNGELQTATCGAALNELHREEKLILPWKSDVQRGTSLVEETVSIDPAVNVPESVDLLDDLSVRLVDDDKGKQTWSALMHSEHPLGNGPLVGRQVKYLIVSDTCGILGGLGFAAAALNLEARDRWIGWNNEIRRNHLDQVVCLSRFLIRPDIHCRDLASHILSLSIKQLKSDFARYYGYCPLLLESFSDLAHGDGSTYRAANWLYIGQTKGRGRQDRENSAIAGIKDIYVYPLHKQFREKLGLSRTAGLSPLPIDEELESSQWAGFEFGNAPLGDKRLSKRLVQIADSKAHVPGANWSSVVDGRWADVKSYYRFIDQPEESGVSVENILAPHRERTIRRMDAQQTVLCIQDGSDLNFSTLDSCEGLGVIGGNQTGAKTKGLHMHSTFAVTPDGLPLGVLRSDIGAPASVPKKQAGYKTPIEEKKTFCWIESLRDLDSIAKGLPTTRLISVMDREADFYDLFEEQSSSRVEVIVRAKHNRVTTSENSDAGSPEKLFELVRSTDSSGKLEITLSHQSARSKKSKTKARAERKARTAIADIRFTRCHLQPPSCRKDSKPIEVTIVHVLEESPLDGAEPVEWFLLTSLQVNDFETAIRIADHYCKRWRIEDWHRVLKSGCNIEEISHQTAERLARAIAIDLVIGWRIMLMTLLGRGCGDLPAEVMFSDLELRVIKAWAKDRRIPLVENLNDAVKVVARMGGYLGRKSDPPPGHQVIWTGFCNLSMFCVGFVLRE